MKPKQPKAKTTVKGRLQPVPVTGTVDTMTSEQATLLRELARDGYEPDAFSSQLTRKEAAIRIATLQAKLTLQGKPPHTL
jgi:hypothetical protein